MEPLSRTLTSRRQGGLIVLIRIVLMPYYLSIAVARKHLDRSREPPMLDHRQGLSLVTTSVAKYQKQISTPVRNCGSLTLPALVRQTALVLV